LHQRLGAKASKVFLAFNRRFDAGHAALKRAIELGEIGNLEQLTITSRDPAPPPLFGKVVRRRRGILPVPVPSRGTEKNLNGNENT
jgi:predicted dehydrogenase